MLSERYLLIISILVSGICSPVSAQDINVSRSNKTVEVTVTESVEADPEVVVITIGHHNYGRTQDAAFADNAHVANRLTQALLEAGIPKQDIQTESVKLGRPEPQEKWSQEQRVERQFEAVQSWTMRVQVARAESILGLAVTSGANEVEDVDWQVSDPAALERKAGAAALVKARTLADQIVKELGGKLGELLYASNTARRPKGWPFFATQTATLSAAVVRPRVPETKLFPKKKVEQEATVHAIFAIE